MLAIASSRLDADVDDVNLDLTEKQLSVWKAAYMR